MAMFYLSNKSKKIILNFLKITVSIYCGCIYCFASSTTNEIKNSQKPLDRIVAVVNDDVITDAELSKKVDIVKNKLAKNGQSVELPSSDEIKKQVLNSMVLETLQLQIAKANNISAMPDQVNNTINTIAKQNNISIVEFKKKLERDGIGYEDFKNDIIKQLTLMNTQRAAAQAEIKITAQELDQEIKRLQNSDVKTSYRLSHILIAVPNSPDSEHIISAQRKAEKVMKDLKSGKDFAAIAIVASDNQQALQGGDLGWYNSAELPTIFADVVPKLTKNEIYGPIQNESGFHIIKLSDIKHDDKKFQETQYKVKHILIKNDEITSDLVAKQELAKLRQEILQKNNIEDLALIYSEDVASASKGGDLGWVSSNALVPEFARVIESLKQNQVSEPFQTPYGWHIAKLEGTRKVDNTLVWHRNQAKQIIENRKFQDAIATWQNKIRSESHIKILI